MSRGVELPYTIFGRHLRPFSFALMLATFTIALQFYLLPEAPGEGWSQHVMGTLGMLGVLGLFFGWALKSDPVHDFGLLFVSGVWVGRTFLFGAQNDWLYVGTYLSACWAIAAIGAWLLERYDHKWQHEVADRHRRRIGDAHE